MRRTYHTGPDQFQCGNGGIQAVEMLDNNVDKRQESLYTQHKTPREGEYSGTVHTCAVATSSIPALSSTTRDARSYATYQNPLSL